MNGPYERDGESEGRPLFRRIGDPTIVLEYRPDGWCFMQWDDDDQGIGYCMYKCKSAQEMPPSTGWEIEESDEPPPSIEISAGNTTAGSAGTKRVREWEENPDSKRDAAEPKHGYGMGNLGTAERPTVYCGVSSEFAFAEPRLHRSINAQLLLNALQKSTQLRGIGSWTCKTVASSVEGSATFTCAEFVAEINVFVERDNLGVWATLMTTTDGDVPDFDTFARRMRGILEDYYEDLPMSAQ